MKQTTMERKPPCHNLQKLHLLTYRTQEKTTKVKSSLDVVLEVQRTVKNASITPIIIAVTKKSIKKSERREQVT